MQTQQQTQSSEKFIERIRAMQAENEQAHAAGIQALKRLLTVALGHSGQCSIVAGFLLSLYNGMRFKFDLTDFRGLDAALFEDCMTVLRMDKAPKREVHMYFVNGGEIWERMARDWGTPDYWKLNEKVRWNGQKWVKPSQHNPY